MRCFFFLIFSAGKTRRCVFLFPKSIATNGARGVKLKKIDVVTPASLTVTVVSVSTSAAAIANVPETSHALQRERTNDAVCRLVGTQERAGC